MGEGIEQWRAAIGLWSGGRQRRRVTSQHHIAQTSNHIGYKYIRFLVLVSLLVIGCVELNPGPDHETSAQTQSAGARLKFLRRTEALGLHGYLYEVKTAAFLFARALNKTEEFRLASNVEGVGAFDDLVFRYRLRESDVWKTCFIQLKHKARGGTIQRCSLTQMSGDFSLLEYFKLFCKMKSNATTDRNLIQFGPFGEFEFVIYTNRKIGSKRPLTLHGGESDPLSILSSGTDDGKYIAFDEERDTDIYGFFEELAKYHELIKELDNLLKGGRSVGEDIILKIDTLKSCCSNKDISRKLNILQSNTKHDCVSSLIEEVSKCDFTLFREFLSKVKIFQGQFNGKTWKEQIEKELQEVCKATPSVRNFIYGKFLNGLYKWWKRNGKVDWLNKNSGHWQRVKGSIITERKKISKPEIQEIEKCGIRFNQQHVQELSDAIKQNTVLNIVTKSKAHNLQKLKTIQVLNILRYKKPLCIGIKDLMNKRKEIYNLWPCTWSGVLVVDGGSDGNVVYTVLDILQQSADCGQGLNISYEKTAGPLVDHLQKYEQKLIIISTKKMASGFQNKLINISYFDDNCDILDLNKESQKQILERHVNFQGTNVKLSSLVGTDPPETMKALLDSEVISILLSNKRELSVGRQLDDHCKYYVPRVLQHEIYLKEDILKLTDYEVTFAVSGLQAEELVNYLPAGEKIYEFVYDERKGSHNFKIVSDFFKSGFSDELESTKSDSEAGQNIKPEEVRYIILGNKNPENEFRELKKLPRKVHWIHLEEGSFLWRDSNYNIDVILKYIDNTKCKKYNDMKTVVEHKDRTILLLADPGMGKTTFLSYMAHEIKTSNSAVWVLRINLIEHTKEFGNTDFEQECIDQCKEFLWKAAHDDEHDALNFTKGIFLHALEQPEKMVIILDGFDEIYPYYSQKVEMIIRAIRGKMAAKIWISSRFSCRKKLEDILRKFPFTLKPFTKENQIQVLELYWTKDTGISNQGNLKMFAEELIKGCNQNFSDKDGEFTGIPLQTMMLGEAFANSAEQYCCSGEFKLPEKFNLLDLFQKFWKKKCHIYICDKNGIEETNPIAIKEEQISLEIHMTYALKYLLSLNEQTLLHGEINVSGTEQEMTILKMGKPEDFGIIKEIVDGNPHFIHRCFAEYFAAKWLIVNYGKCGEIISNIFLESKNEVTRNIFDRMLANDSELHGSVLSNDIQTIKEILKDKQYINTTDKGGRTALHLAASYNSPCIQHLLSCEGIDAKKPDELLKWTPLRYADRTQSWMAMDILLQNGANPDDIVLSKPNSESQERVQRALWECASEGHIKLLEFMLNCGIEVNELVEVPENLQEKFTLLHRASYCGQVEVVRLIVNRGADINIRDAKKNTAIHLAAESGSVGIIKLLLDKKMSVNLTNTHDTTPLHVSAQFGHLEATKALVKGGADLNSTDKFGNTPLMVAAHKGNLEIVRYLTEKDTDISICNKDKNTALHLASASGSVDIIALLLDGKVPVNLTNKPKFTPLHISARFGHLEATKVLVERGADVDIINEYGHTPLMVAAYNDKLEIFRYLIDKGADIHFRNDNNNSVIRYAAKSGNVEMIKLLLDRGMSVNETDKKGSTPLHVTAQFGHLEATKLLVDRRAALDKNNKYGSTPLMLAALEKKLDIVLYLTGMNSDVNIRDHNKNTALHYAAESGSVDIIKLLLGKGMSVNLTDKDDNTPLHVTAQYGNLEATKTLVERGAAKNKTNNLGRTPLMMAAHRGKLDIFRYLTDNDADLKIRDDNNNNSALHFVSAWGTVDTIKSLLDKGMSVNSTNTHEFTPLHVSAEFGHLEATKLLVERGAAINNTNKYGDTPLMLAAYKGKLEIFSYLTEIGAEFNILDANNNTALHFASASGNVDIIKSLLDKGLSVNLTNKDEFTPLHVSAEFGHLEATTTLVERGAAINNTNKFGETPLMLAAYKGKLETFRYLTEKGAEFNIRDANNNTALRFVSASGTVDIIKSLLDNGMYVNLTNTDEFTPLHFSAEFGHLEATKTLVESGAAINITDKYGETPLMVAAYKGKLEIFHYLTQKGAEFIIHDANNNTALHFASASGNVDIIKSLMDKGMPVNLTNTDEFTPLHVSAEFGQLEATKILVERGAAINNTNKYGETPLMMAAYKGKLGIVRYLNKKGAEINTRDANNNTALHFASASGIVDIIKSLLDKGISVNLTNTDEFTPLHVSADFGHLEATIILVERGAAINNTDKYGDTPLMVAAYKGKLEIFRYLTKKGAEFNTRDANNNTALHFASASGNVDIITSLLDNGMSVNLTNKDNSTLLHVSAEFGHLEATKLLVERGAAINNIDKYGNTPLMLALYNDKLELCRYLKGIGADINILGTQNNYGIEFL